MMDYSLSSYYKSRSYLYSFALLTAMLALLGLVGWLLAGTTGILWFLFAGLFIFISAPRFTPRLILGMHQAQRLQPDTAPQLYQILYALAERAGLTHIPELHYIPSTTINAFTTGLRNNAAIALSDGMLNQLDTRELTAVLAHEVSHIQSNDLLVMMIANVINRLTSTMALVGHILVWLYIPLFILTDAQIPWALMITLMIAPTLSVLMQLSLSRSHEFKADLLAAELTDDPLGLASALEKIEYYQGNWVNKIIIPSRRMYETELLRTHPLMTERIKRLRELASRTPGAGQHPGTDSRLGKLFSSPSNPPDRWFRESL